MNHEGEAPIDVIRESNHIFFWARDEVARMRTTIGDRDAMIVILSMDSDCARVIAREVFDQAPKGVERGMAEAYIGVIERELLLGILARCVDPMMRVAIAQLGRDGVVLFGPRAVSASTVDRIAGNRGGPFLN